MEFYCYYQTNGGVSLVWLWLAKLSIILVQGWGLDVIEIFIRMFLG